MAFQLEQLLDFTIQNDGSDLILSVDNVPALRVNGTIRSISKKKVTQIDTLTLSKKLLKAHKQQELEELGTTDFSFTYKAESVFRGSFFRQQGKLSLALRYLPNRELPIEDLNLPREVMPQLMRPRGLILITGPTGSGKSFTMQRFLNHINENSTKHIITIEDPIEVRYKSKKSFFNQREVGEDVPSFSEALKRSLRQDPDIIMVGEMRDLETIETALLAAETGHLVISTLHTKSAVDTVLRVIGAFPPDQQTLIRTQLASSLNMVVSQNLIKGFGPKRVLASEVMMLSHSIRHLIRENRIHQIPSVIETSSIEGCRLMDTHLCQLVLLGDISESAAFEQCSDPSSFQARMTDIKNKTDFWVNCVKSGQLTESAALAACPNQKSLQLALKSA